MPTAASSSTPESPLGMPASTKGYPLSTPQAKDCATAAELVSHYFPQVRFRPPAAPRHAWAMSTRPSAGALITALSSLSCTRSLRLSARMAMQSAVLLRAAKLVEARPAIRPGIGAQRAHAARCAGGRPGERGGGGLHRASARARAARGVRARRLSAGRSGPSQLAAAGYGPAGPGPSGDSEGRFRP